MSRGPSNGNLDQRRHQLQAGTPLAQAVTPAGLRVDAYAASPPLQSTADRATVRLEVLRLAHRHDVPAEQIIDRARALAAYVLGEPEADKAE